MPPNNALEPTPIIAVSPLRGSRLKLGVVQLEALAVTSLTTVARRQHPLGQFHIAAAGGADVFVFALHRDAQMDVTARGGFGMAQLEAIGTRSGTRSSTVLGLIPARQLGQSIKLVAGLGLEPRSTDR